MSSNTVEPASLRQGPRSLADELEDGPLKRELGGAPPPPPPPASLPEPVFRARLAFDGQGAEYFRIWVVNVLLTIVTLGVYSAWAKVRKARWFAQHTSLLGDRFDYHGDPRRILVGRVLALALLALWTWSFDLAAWLGLVMFGLLLVAGPVLFAGAQRFRLANTSWRGLRFDFQAPRREVYWVCVPLLVVWTLSTLMSALGAPEGWVLGASVPLVLLMPWAHAQLKRMQHSRARFGDQTFSFEPAGREFYELYAKGVFLAIVVLVPLTMILSLAAAELLERGAGTGAGTGQPTTLELMLTGAGLALLLWVMVWPYFAARTQQIVWGHTRFAGRVGFAGHMRGWALWKLVIGQSLFTLLTAGLYWPFAAVAIARYRIESVEVVGDQPLPVLRVQAGSPPADRAAADAAADVFGLDLGW